VPREVWATIYSNPRKKKEVSQDGFVVVTLGARVALHDEQGKQLSGRPWRSDDKDLAAGGETSLGGLSCELLESVAVAIFDSLTSPGVPAPARAEAPPEAAAAAPPPPQMHRPQLARAAAVSASSEAGAPVAAGASSRVYTTIYSNPRKKKAVSQDGFVVLTVGVRAALHDEQGKQLAVRPWRSDDEALAAGGVTPLGGLSCELVESVAMATFESLTSSGASSSARAEAPPQVAAAPPPAPQRAFQAPSGNPSASRAGRDASRGSLSIVEPGFEPDGALLLNAGDRDATPVFVEAQLARQMRPHQKEGVQFMYECVTGR